MSALSRITLALAVSAAACSEQSPVVPQSGSNSDATVITLSAPTDLRAAFLGASGEVVISWTLPDNPIRIAGFLVERASEPAGPWSINRFTQGTSFGDALSLDQRYCYRVVTVASSSSNSPPSLALCITRSASGIWTTVSLSRPSRAA